MSVTGPRVDGSKALLFAFIDDRSRLVVGHRWGRREEVLRLEAALRRAFSSRGIPDQTDPPPHPCDLRPCTDYRSREIIRKAVVELGLARRLDPDHPAVRTHLLGSLVFQAEHQRSATITEFVDHGYNPIEISILLGLG